jgi:hypothetical protein
MGIRIPLMVSTKREQKQISGNFGQEPGLRLTRDNLKKDLYAISLREQLRGVAPIRMGHLMT